jgi:uncharacterized delta-60 repeat protein
MNIKHAGKTTCDLDAFTAGERSNDLKTRQIHSASNAAICCVVVMLMLFPAALPASAGLGVLDPLFSGDGKLTDWLSLGDDSVSGVAVQPDGKIVVAGSSWTVRSDDFAVARYNLDGSLDSTFGTGGKVTTDFGSSYDWAYAVAIQPDGKIVLAGQSQFDFALVRYNPDGSLDSTFGVDGKVTTNFGPNISSTAYSVAVHTDGKIVAAGQANSDFAVVRYNPNGSLDTSFDGDGKVTTGIFTLGHDAAFAVAIHANGKIVAAGSGYIPTSGRDVFTLVQYNVNGSLDTSFDGDGIAASPPGTNGSRANSVAIQADGKIVAVGQSCCTSNTTSIVGYRYNTDGSINGQWGTNPTIPGFFGYANAHSVAVQPDGKIDTIGTIETGGQNGMAFIRLNADLSADPTFGTGGVLIRPLDSHVGVSSAAVQPDGTIVVAGNSWSPSGQDINVLRFTSSGTFDTSFDGDGKVTTDFGFFQGNVLYDTAIQPDGKILAVGGVRTDFALLRYNSDGLPDTTFGSGTGKVRTDMGSSGDTARAVAIQTDAKMVVAGGSYDWDDNQCCFALARYNADGSLDATFSGDGKVVTGFYDGTGVSGDGAFDVVIQPDGKIVAAGNRWGNQSGFLVIRYNADGSLDTSFDGDGIVTTPLGPNAGAASVIIQPDGKLVATGSSSNGFTVVRYNPNGSLDSTFDGDGIATTFTSQYDAADSSVLQPDGKIIVAGSRGVLTSYDDPPGVFVLRYYALIRYNPNGSLDTSFGTGGVAATQEEVAYGSASHSVALQPDGKIVIAGSDVYPDFAVIRYNANGSIDTSFGYKGTKTADFEGSIDYAYGMALDNSGRAVVVGESDGKFAIARFQLDVGEKAVTAFDYDGDGRADLSVRRPSDNVWHLLRATAGYTAMEFGEAGDKMVPADYDGDGKTDVAVWRPPNGTWYAYMSATQAFQQFGWGEDGDLPVPTDRDADGKTDLVVFRPSNNTWYTRYANGTFNTFVFGEAGDKPVVGDFDGDGIGDAALFRPSNNNWYIIKSSLGFFIQTWGEAGDLPLTADFDGDGKTDQAVFRPATGQWFLSRTSEGFANQSWGQVGDVPVPADYDGDGRADVAVFRPTNGTWYIVQSAAGILVQQFGVSGDVPTQSAFSY